MSLEPNQQNQPDSVFMNPAEINELSERLKIPIAEKMRQIQLCLDDILVILQKNKEEIRRA